MRSLGRGETTAHEGGASAVDQQIVHDGRTNQICGFAILLKGICKFAEMYVMYTIIYNIDNILSIGVFFLSPCHIRLFTVLANYRKIANFLGEILSNRHKLWDQF